MNDNWKYFLEENAEQLNEVNEDILNKVLARANTKLAFDDVFGNAKRIVLPNKLGGQLEKINKIIYDKILQATEPDGIAFDLQNKKVLLTIFTNNGDKQREISIIKYFQDFSKILDNFIATIPKEIDYTKFSELFVKYKIPRFFYAKINSDLVYDIEETKRQYIQKMETLQKTISYVISELQKIYNLPPKMQNDGRLRVLVSRSPIDVLRMSDFKGIRSCHSPEGSYFQCAITEAINEGLVAYLVDEQDLSSVDIEDGEIFSDGDRGQTGIVPIARLRLRSYTVDNGNVFKIFIPSEKVYSSHQPEFKRVVNEWAKEVQSKKIEILKSNNTRDTIISQQASYVDSGDSSEELFEKILGETPEFNFNIDDDAELDEFVQRFDEQEIRRINQRADRVLTYFSFNVEINDDNEEQALYPYARLSIPLVKLQEFGEVFSEFANKPYQEQRIMKNFISETLLDHNYYVEEFNVDSGDSLEIVIDISDFPNDEGEASLMLRTFEELDRNLFEADGSINSLYEKLVKDGYLVQEPVEQNHEFSVQNFKVLDEDDKIVLYSIEQKHSKGIDFREIFKEEYQEILEKKLVEKDLTLKNRVESITTGQISLSFDYDFKAIRNYTNLGTGRYTFTDIYKLFFKSVITAEIYTGRISENYIEFIFQIGFKKNKFLLENSDFFKELVKFMDSIYSDYQDTFEVISDEIISYMKRNHEYELRQRAVLAENLRKNKKIILTLRGK